MTNAPLGVSCPSAPGPGGIHTPVQGGTEEMSDLRSCHFICAACRTLWHYQPPGMVGIPGSKLAVEPDSRRTGRWRDGRDGGQGHPAGPLITPSPTRRYPSLQPCPLTARSPEPRDSTQRRDQYQENHEPQRHRPMVLRDGNIQYGCYRYDGRANRPPPEQPVLGTTTLLVSFLLAF
jgi:hypothetical protein